MAAFYVAIFAFQKKSWYIGSAIYSFGLGIKMNLLLALPALAITLLQALGRDKAITQALIIAQVQVRRWLVAPSCEAEL
jgi:alpha-1,3-mannosyltransferase